MLAAWPSNTHVNSSCGTGCPASHPVPHTFLWATRAVLPATRTARTHCTLWWLLNIELLPPLPHSPGWGAGARSGILTAEGKWGTELEMSGNDPASRRGPWE